MSNLRDAALNLAARGFRIFPCRVRSKEPLINDNLTRATTDPNLINGWWSAADFNIGIATGADSKLWVLDVDGDEGEATLRTLEATHGKLPATAESVTGSGRHLYFSWPSNIEIRNSQCREDLPGLDVRGNGGYVVAPPSLHPNGHFYRWSDVAAAFVAAPDWLIELVTKSSSTTGSSTAEKSPEEWCSFFGESFDGSRRGGAVAKATGFLLRKHIDPMVTLDLVRLFNYARCEPPLDDAEIIRTVTSISRRELQRREGRRP